MYSSDRDVEIINRALQRLIRKILKDGDVETDILEHLQFYLTEAQERAIDAEHRRILEKDPNFFEDPNAVIHQSYPVVDRTSSGHKDRLTFEDIAIRNPYTKEEMKTLRQSYVGMLGCGGMQLLAMALIRSGLGNLTIADHDVFEASNANRQLFCFSDTLDRYKVDVVKEFLEKINREARIYAEKCKVTEGNVAGIFRDSQIIVDSSGDLEARRSVHRYAKAVRKPIVTVAWAGNEGQYITLMPDDPDYFDIFDYSPYNPERGNHPSGLMTMNAIVANEVVKMLTDGPENIVRYPYMVAINTRSRIPVKVRNVEYVRKRGIHKR